MSEQCDRANPCLWLCQIDSGTMKAVNSDKTCRVGQDRVNGGGSSQTTPLRFTWRVNYQSNQRATTHHDFQGLLDPPYQCDDFSVLAEKG